MNIHACSYEGNPQITLSLGTENGNPAVAASFKTRSWSDAGGVIDVDEAAQVRLTLSVSHSTERITSFSFDILIIGSG